MNDCYHIKDGSIHLAVKALPGASKTEFAGVKDGTFRVKIAAAPEGGRANTELIAFISRKLGCAKRDVSILRGEKSRFKTITLPPECEQELRKYYCKTPHT